MWNVFNKKKSQVALGAIGEGKLMDLSDVKDDAFASKSMGDGYALALCGNVIYAPCDGEIIACFPGGHALGLQHDDLEIMIHIGIDTVELAGEGFRVLVNANDHVNAGQPLVEVDSERILAQGYDLTSMVIVTSGQAVTITKSLDDVHPLQEVATCSL